MTSMATLQKPPENPVFSSSPAFATPIHPIPPTQAQRPPPPPVFKPAIPTILPILLPPPTLRPLAFRTFTKKHNLTLNSSALQALASFIGRHCGSGWREEGTGEKVLEEVAKLWKAEAGPVIVDDGQKLKTILNTLDGCMTGGRVAVLRTSNNLSRQSSFAFGNDSAVELSDEATRPGLEGHRNSSFGLSKLQVEEEEGDEHDAANSDPRAWIKVVSAFEQPRLSYDKDKKHFDAIKSKPTMFPSPSHKSALVKERYNIIYQRLLRNEAFQAPTFDSRRAKNAPSRAASSVVSQRFYKVTPISNLLGRGGTSHLLLGMLAIAPTGTLALNDPSGSIHLDLQHAQQLQGEDSAFFCPGMIVLIDGVYEEDWVGAGSSGLGDTGGVGGSVGGRFIGFSIGGPPVERRNVSLGFDLKTGEVGGGFGWTDFTGVGSERAVGDKMRRLERRLLSPDSEIAVSASSSGRRKVIFFSGVSLDQPQTLVALRKVLERYASAAASAEDDENTTPLAFVLMGNFCSQAAMAGAGLGSIEYKEMFNELAAVLADFPSLLRSSSWIFVPGDNDPWASAFSAGASSLLPKSAIPDIFTSRLKRAFALAKAEAPAPARKDVVDGEAVWTTNPARLTLFGSAHEVVLFRDDIAGRFRRSAVRIGQAVKQERSQETNHQEQQQNESSVDQDNDISMSGALPSEPAALASISDTIEIDSMPLEPPQTLPSESIPNENTALLEGEGAGDDSYATTQAKKLILSLLPQSTLSPFPLATRPVHWDYASSALSLYPLPHTLVLADAESAAFAVTFEGCHVVNPGSFVSGSGRRRKVEWVEYDSWSKRGTVMEDWMG